jgi:hypothetical protein
MQALGAKNGVGAVPFLSARGISVVDLAVSRRKIDHPELRGDQGRNQLRIAALISEFFGLNLRALFDDEVAGFGQKRRCELRKTSKAWNIAIPSHGAPAT